MNKIYESPIGPLFITIENSGLTGIGFTKEPDLNYGNDEKTGTDIQTAVYNDTKRWLDIYFSKKSPNFFPTMNLKGTDFQKAVWTLLLDIPFGKTVTYKYLAEKAASQLGKSRMSAQAIGGAVGKNPVAVIVPCHRVIGSDGSLTGYAGGLDKKEKLLATEGIFIR